MKRKILSLLTAFAMVFGIIAAPFTSAMAADTSNVNSGKSKANTPVDQYYEGTQKPRTDADAPANAENATTTSKIKLHKIVMDSENFKAWKPEQNRTNGGKITDIAKFFGKGSKEVQGVRFEVYKEVAGDYTAKPNETVVEGSKLKAANNNFEKIDTNKKYLLVAEKDTATDGTEDIDLNSSLDKDNEQKVKTTKFIIVENLEKSTYKTDDGKTISKIGHAIPALIELPATIMGGDVLHLYPKNTESIPQIDKNFAKGKNGNGLEKAEGNFDSSYRGTEAGEVTDINAGANYENYNKKKMVAKAQVGKVVPYEVKTKIPGGTEYKRLVWNDTMDNGLTYNKDLAVSKSYDKDNIVTTEKEKKNITTGIQLFKLDDKGQRDGDSVALEKDTDYTIFEDDRGFELKFTTDGLAKVAAITKGKTPADAEIVLTYTATLNGKAIVDKPENNDIKFEYGNKPKKDVEPKEVQPKDKKIEVKKTWGADGNNTVTKEDKDAVVVYTLQKKNGENWENVESVTKKYDEENAAESYNHTFENLDDNATYRVVERVSGYKPENTSTEKGVTTYKNVKDEENPKPLNPTEPKVVSGGKKFVKTDDKEAKNRLMGAKFFVKNSDGDYLYAKETSSEAVESAKKDLDNKIAEYNKMSAEEQKGTKGTNKKAEIDQAQEKYNKVFRENAIGYEWKAAPGQSEEDKRVVLTSDAQGRFEITGLAYAKDYELEEKEAPEGYAKTSNVKFEIKQGSYTTEDVNIKYNKEGQKDNDAKQVINKNLTIPQTGGIGSLVFIAAGLAIMGGAFIAYRRSQATA